jgi:hypothetical protein
MTKTLVIALAIDQILNSWQVLDRVHPFPLEKDLFLPPSSQAMKKGKPIQTRNAITNHNLFRSLHMTFAFDLYT